MKKGDGQLSLFRRKRKMSYGRRKKIKQALLMNKCNYCHSTENLTIDHKVALSMGGSDELDNMQCLCQRCNSIKGNLSHKQIRHLFKWFKEIQSARLEEKRKRLEK